ncbi:MAG TPA: tetratricopeptide repeat protein [Candidatus Binatia bacterium]|jgi:tetratricopeptide (TPR) repeat protein
MLKCRKALFVAAGVAACALGLRAIAAASPQSHQLVVMGHADLSAGNYQEAVKKFDAAIKADPNDAEAVYFSGAALNRAGKFKDALARLQGAFAMGYRQPALAFDSGWALLRLGYWTEAIAQLEYFERNIGGRGKTSEFMGQAYLGLRQYDQAEAKLKEAVQRDADLKPTVLLYLALLERERKNPEAADGYLEALFQQAPDSAIARTLKKQMDPIPEPKKK